MAFDFKKEYKEFYLPQAAPAIITVQPVRYIVVAGKGDPNQEGGNYKQAVAVLYAMAYTLKMSYRGSRQIDGFFEYVVPPLEGLWWREGMVGVDYVNKADFQWLSVLRLPDFIRQTDFDWAVTEAGMKKGIDCSAAQLHTASAHKITTKVPLSARRKGDFNTIRGAVRVHSGRRRLPRPPQ